ncbi:MAG TPA: sulfite exporter TauE/SafE family protein [Telluria sp.]
MITSAVLGTLIGVLLALTGAGGGILAVPMLVFGAQLSVAQAGPIALMAVGMAAGVGAVLGLRAGVVRYRAAMLVAATGMLLSPVGVWLAGRVDNRWLSILFALVLMYVAWKTWRGTRPSQAATAPAPEPLCRRSPETRRFIWTRPCALALGLSGTVAGLLSGLLGVGGGFVMVPALKRVTDLPMQAVVATSLAVIALVSVSGVAASAVNGTVDWSIALPFTAGAIAGMLGGRAVSARLAGPHLQVGFAAVAAIVALTMIARVAL